MFGPVSANLDGVRAESRIIREIAGCGGRNVELEIGASWQGGRGVIDYVQSRVDRVVLIAQTIAVRLNWTLIACDGVARSER